MLFIRRISVRHYGAGVGGVKSDTYTAARFKASGKKKLQTVQVTLQVV